MIKSFELFETAKSDLDAAISLIKIAHNPQALFFTQQATEIIWKFIAKNSDFITDDDFKKIGHDLFRLIRKISANQLSIINSEPFDNLSEDSKDTFNLEQKRELIENALTDLDRHVQTGYKLSETETQNIIDILNFQFKISSININEII